jgi:hypothetical protein
MFETFVLMISLTLITMGLMELQFRRVPARTLRDIERAKEEDSITSVK